MSQGQHIDPRWSIQDIADLLGDLVESGEFPEQRAALEAELDQFVAEPRVELVLRQDGSDQ